MESFKFDLITLHPKVFDAIEEMGIIGKAILSKKITINRHDLRNFGIGNYRQVDDQPYGGGSGMVLKPEPIYSAINSIKKENKCQVILMTPQGKNLKQNDFYRWAKEFKHLIIVSGQYEGFDERVRDFVDEEISVGDYVLTGGEIPAMIIINGVIRVLPGTVGDPESLKNESHNDNLLEYPHYTRPSVFRGLRVPEILRSGNHKEIELWRSQQMINRTEIRRKDLFQDRFNQNSPKHKRIINNSDETLDFRIGNGYDIHRLVKGRNLILGGIKIKHPEGLGLEGHSDADVLAHSIMDAMLGALSMGDIGKYFPPENMEWKNSDSMKLLSKVVNMIHQRGWKVNNLDSVIVAERPKVKPYIELIRENIAGTIGISKELIGVKATTNEKLGPEGREEGISSHVVVLLERNA
tara:strand:- start:2103 stop:3329 length:1227 start_codon:yes stop_codon:yes gene_type:complete